MDHDAFDDSNELDELQELASSTAGTLAVWRARIVLFHMQGETYREVSSRFGCSQATVAKWVRRWREEGEAGLESRPRAATLGPQQRVLRKWLPKAVSADPAAKGFDRSRWTLKTLQQLCDRELGQRPSLETIRRELIELDIRL